MNKKIFDYVRHLSEQDTKNLSQKVTKCAEELGELAKASLPYDNAFATNHRFSIKEKILEEVVDLTLCALSVAYDLKFTDQEIADMMVAKSAKWAGLQAGEKDLKYPIPFEIHVTVAYGNAPAWYDKNPIEYFKVVCSRENIKPILLDLHTKSDVVIKDLMTSSVHFGTNASAHKEAMRIANMLHEYLYDVLRVKIETVPQHPASPKLTNNLPMPKDCYFESHIPVIIDKNDIDIIKESISEQDRYDIHVSNNAFKVHDNGRITLMLTYRTHTERMEEFEKSINNIVQLFKNDCVEVGKVHKEFSIYDTKVLHDGIWMENLDK